MKRLILIALIACTSGIIQAQETETTQETKTEIPKQIPESYEGTETEKGLSEEKIQEITAEAKGFASQELIISKSMSVRVEEGELAMSKGANNAIMLTLPNADAKKAAAIWKTYTKSFKSKTKKVKGSDEMFSDNARLPDVSDNSVDIYASFDDSGDGSVVSVWFDLGGAYLNSYEHRRGYGGAVTMLEEYSKEVGKSVEEEQLKLDEKALKILIKDLDKLKKSNELYHNKIDDAKKLITEMESNIKQNLQDQEKKNTEIKTQKDTVKKTEERIREF